MDDTHSSLCFILCLFVSLTLVQGEALQSRVFLRSRYGEQVIVLGNSLVEFEFQNATNGFGIVQIISNPNASSPSDAAPFHSRPISLQSPSIPTYPQDELASAPWVSHGDPRTKQECKSNERVRPNGQKKRSIASIDASEPKSWNFLLPLSEYGQPAMMWIADFRDPMGRGYYLDSTSVSAHKEYRVENTKDGVAIVFTWSSINFGYKYTQSKTNITVRVELDHHSSLARFSLNVFNPRESEGKPCLWSIQFAVINNIGSTHPEYDTLFIPEGMGVTKEDPGSHGNFNAIYPSGTMSMQYMSFCHFPATDKEANACLYYGAHDGHGYTKTFQYVADQYSGTDSAHSPRSSMSVQHSPPNTCVPDAAGQIDTTFDLQYNIVIGVHPGDWWDSSQIYRDFVMEHAQWTERGPLANRTDFPEWFKEAPLWVNTGWEGAVLNWTEGNPDIVVKRISEFVKVFNISGLAVHWYCWHEIPFDTDYPDYFPAKQGFEAAVAKLQSLGVKVFPYINGRLYDWNAASWHADNAGLYTTKQSAPRLKPQSIQPYVSSYGSKQNFAVMCPNTTFWQQKIAGIVNQLVNVQGVDGVYIDQIAAAGVQPCADPTHHHTTVGGNHWYNGYEHMLDLTNQLANGKKPAALVTESNNELFMKYLNGYLVLQGFEQCPMVPAFQAVYGGYIVPFGRIFDKRDALFKDWLTMKFAHMYVMGTQLGWVSLGGSYSLYDYLLAPESKAQRDYINRVSTYRSLGLKYLLHGRAMRDLTVTNAVDFINIDGCLFSEVQATVWKATDGSLGIPVTSGSSSDTTEFNFKLSVSDYGLEPNKTYSFDSITPNGTHRITTFNTNTFTYSVKVSPLQVYLFVIQPL